MSEPRSSSDGSLRARKRAMTRDAIVAHGLRLFLERGFDDVTVAEIAAAAVVSPTTVFRYFGTKEALLFANHDAEQQALCDAVRRSCSLSGPRAVMAAAVLELAATMRPEEELYAARMRIITSSPALLGAALRTRLQWEDAAAAELAEASSRPPEVADHVAATAAVGALHVAVREWHARSGGTPLTQCLQETLAALWPDVVTTLPERR